MPKDDNCVHKDHRKRMKTNFVHSGADAFETHQLLEMLLFYAIPQKDTNPLAHDLLQNFGSLNSVLNADYESLTQLCGVKENTAVLLKLIFALARRSEQEKLSHCDIHSDFDSVGEFLVRQYRLLDKELVYLLLFDNSRRMFGVHQIHEGSVNSAMVDHQKIAKLALMRNAAGIVLAHNVQRERLALCFPHSEFRCLIIMLLPVTGITELSAGKAGISAEMTYYEFINILHKYGTTVRY